ncbi:hypothetical protein E3N88_18804 [Mikania micrantha]|uniref:Uncharacterized protein n=1 Tax=Mikania micrantha TaxID=192012 RepID=A0A5N6NP52_9ASTR|nr:hypothetical protein E3N88_18804 [Mikania micrantha]
MFTHRYFHLRQLLAPLAIHHCGVINNSSLKMFTNRYFHLRQLLAPLAIHHCGVINNSSLKMFTHRIIYITEELNKAKSTSGGDDTPVDEVEVLERSLGQRRGHVRGVGRTIKSITPDLPPHMYAPAANELQQQLAEANARLAEQQRINEMMQQQINKLMSMQGGQSSISPNYPGFEENQYEDQDEDNESD